MQDGARNSHFTQKDKEKVRDDNFDNTTIYVGKFPTCWLISHQTKYLSFWVVVYAVFLSMFTF